MALQPIPSSVESFLRGARDLSGPEVYDLLEANTPLVRLRDVFRGGARNRLRDGSQQSYAEHNRMLLLGLDRLVAGDLDWYRTRLIEPDAVSDATLSRCFATVTAAGLDRPILLTLWVAASMHDCGMLVEGQPGIDVENGVVVARPTVEWLCPPETTALAMFAIRHHDYIKDVFTGEVPATIISHDLQQLPAGQRRLALLVLGMIQVAGAASLGEGRLTQQRMEIFSHCADGSALSGVSRPERAYRLGMSEDPGSSDDASRALLDTVPIHGWHRVWEDREGDRAVSLTRVAAKWAGTGASHIVLGSDFDPRAETKWTGKHSALLSGERALVLN